MLKMSAEINNSLAEARMAVSEMFYAARCMPGWHTFRSIRDAIGIPPPTAALGAKRRASSAAMRQSCSSAVL
jgi:hypothetical protein